MLNPTLRENNAIWEKLLSNSPVFRFTWVCYVTYWFNDTERSLGVNYHSFTWSSSWADFKLLDANIAVIASASWKFILYAIPNISIISNSSQISTLWNCFLSPLAICFLLDSYVFLWQWLCRTHHSREKHNGKYIFKVSCFICELNALVLQINNFFFLNHKKQNSYILGIQNQPLKRPVSTA